MPLIKLYKNPNGSLNIYMELKSKSVWHIYSYKTNNHIFKKIRYLIILINRFNADKLPKSDTYHIEICIVIFQDYKVWLWFYQILLKSY